MNADLITFVLALGLILIGAGLCVALNSALRARERAEGRARRAERLLNYRRPAAMAELQRREVVGR